MIFYNKNNNELNIKLSNNSYVQLEIYSLNGKLLLNEFIKENEFSRKISFKGLLLTKISNDKETTTKIFNTY